MKTRARHSVAQVAGALMLALLACNLPAAISQSQAPIYTKPNFTEAAPATSVAPAAEDTPNAGASAATPSSTTAVTHVMTPGEPKPGALIQDVVSQGTAPEKRAPDGDSFDINRLERPFLQDMTYVPDLDIASYTVASDNDWWYVSIELVGSNPNDPLGIDYGVELDTNHDGFGDYLIWARPPYATNWDTSPVQILEDTNHDTGGLSAEKSDAPMATTTDGYDKRIFNGGTGDTDPDMAWVRINAGPQAAVQIAFKKSWSGSVFMLGVIADGGLKDPKSMDYVDRYTIAQAGSPIRGNANYPLKTLFAVDNVCRSAFGFHVTGEEPQLCPYTAPAATKRPHTPEPPPPPPPPPPIP